MDEALKIRPGQTTRRQSPSTGPTFAWARGGHVQDRPEGCKWILFPVPAAAGRLRV
ncbi:variant surface glycoprotein 3717 [Anopheles sinensis]|uniref:Variant surface glycoprotein 3717 n=1 Tax=Anopheles sinensis TaxID=74873 RepID=A0A084VBF7_ANOSI|nr:variant surface glycoprotein 3717 [Anopheles sinensis]